MYYSVFGDNYIPLSFAYNWLTGMCTLCEITNTTVQGQHTENVNVCSRIK